MRKSLAAFFSVVLLTQGAAEGCGGKKDGESKPATPPAAGGRQIPEGEREPNPHADPVPDRTGERSVARWLYYETDPPGGFVDIAYGVKPGQLTREFNVETPAQRIVHVPTGPMSVLITDAQLTGAGTVQCRIFDPETQNDTARKRKTGVRAMVTCMEDFTK